MQLKNILNININNKDSVEQLKNIINPHFLPKINNSYEKIYPDILLEGYINPSRKEIEELLLVKTTHGWLTPKYFTILTNKNMDELFNKKKVSNK